MVGPRRRDDQDDIGHNVSDDNHDYLGSLHPSLQVVGAPDAEYERQYLKEKASRLKVGVFWGSVGGRAGHIGGTL